MVIYRLELILLEKVFFASREIDELFQTEPVLGNYALTYALGLAVSPYRLSEREDRPYYREDLSALNVQEIYVTPATPLDSPSLEVERFNGMVDSYWYKMANNAVATDLDVRFGARAPVTNFPQKGRLRMLSRGNRFFCHVFSRDDFTPPRYIRLGKFMGKVRVEVAEVWTEPGTRQVRDERIACFLNPLDLSSDTEIGYYDFFNLPPIPLIRNAQLSGWMYDLGAYRLPLGMTYGIPAVETTPRGRGRGRRRG
jgi:CRISPR-associated protein Csc1